ncbi:MAG: glycosyltransferase [Kiritimatiellae bacterium]|nr:glycosyltransferase [Kiritimatiellia bacterium]MBQ8126677.1 glycosyltransferase [Kiritimatiellia bacterium]
MDRLLSIVIANYNYGRYLEEAIKSVLVPGLGRLVELIVCDGGSTDSSVEIIRRYARGLPPNTLRAVRQSTSMEDEINLDFPQITWWCSEKDNGQSDAFNKGFAHARGKYLTWLNADDVFLPGALSKVIKAMRTHPKCEWFTANAIRFLNNGAVYQIWWGPHWYPDILQRTSSPIVAFGPSTFFAKSLFERVGPFDESLQMTMDTDMWLRFIEAGVKQRRINCFCWGFRMHEQSKTAEFNSHSLVGDAARKMTADSRRLDAKHRYEMSKLLRACCLALRLVDGSLARKIWYGLFLLRIKI